MRITVNLATRPFADIGPALRRLRIASGVLAVLALGLWLGLHLLHGRADKVRAQERVLDQSIAQLNRDLQVAQNLEAEPRNAAIIGQAEALNSLIDRKAFSWTLAMEDLETVLPGGVMVTTLEPNVDKKDGHVTVRLHVTGPRDKAVDLVANLEHSHRFLQPRIIGEAIESTSNANPNQQFEPVSLSNRETFDLLADYNPATPAERKEIKKQRAAQAPQPIEAAPQQPPRQAQPPTIRRSVPAPAARPSTAPPQAVPFNPETLRKHSTIAPRPAQPTVQDTIPEPPQAFPGRPQ